MLFLFKPKLYKMGDTKITELIKDIETQLEDAEGVPDTKSWQCEIGVLLSENEAKFVLGLLKSI